MIMYPGFFRSMSSTKSNKESKGIPPKQLNQDVSSLNVQNSELVSLVDTVLQFRESLKKFNYLCLRVSGCEKCSSVIKDLHESLGEVLGIIKKVVDKYPSITSPEVFSTVNALVRYIQSYQKSGLSSSETDRLVNRLALFFSKSITRFILEKRVQAIQGASASSSKKQEAIISNKHSVFGIELEKTVPLNETKIPFIVSRCIKEVEEHGLHVKGIYRVSAVKSKVDQLCEDFEKYGNDIKLNDVNPNIIANVFKLYLRQLPQPLFTFDLYPEFIRIGKLYASDLDTEIKKKCSNDLCSVLAKLPRCYYATASVVMHHLQKIANESNINNMSAYNLAVIFGPTLLHYVKNNSDTNPRNALFDNTHQIRAIELMITSADTLF